MNYGPNPTLVTILRRSTDDNFVRGPYTQVALLMGALRQTTAQQRAEAGMPEDQLDLVIRFAVSAISLGITIDDRFLIGNLNYAVKSIGYPERRGGYIDIGCILSIGN